MTASLTLTGSVAALTAALAAFERFDGEPDAGSRSVAPFNSAAPRMVNNVTPADVDAAIAELGNPTPSTDTGAGILPPMPIPSLPSGAAPIPNAVTLSTLPPLTSIPTIPTGEDDEDEAGEASDGTGTDAEGLPWDERIHSSSKKKTAKGLWAARKGGPKGAELAAIKDELRGVTQVPMPLPVVEQPVAPVAAPVPMPPVPAMPFPVLPVSGVPEAAPIPAPMTAPPPMPVAAAAPAAAEEWDFAKLMAQIGPKMGTVIDPQYLAQVCQHYGIGAITDTATKPELIGQIVAQFQADGRW